MFAFRRAKLLASNQNAPTNAAFYGVLAMAAHINWSFAEACDAAMSVEAISALFMRAAEDLGFSYAACASHVDPLRPPAGAVMMIKYPQAWLAHFSANNYAAIDPVFLAARQQARPFQWSDPRFRAPLSAQQLRVLDEASEAGLKDGIAIPLHAPGALPASCTLVIGPDGVDPLRIPEMHWNAVYAHEGARRLLNPAPVSPPRLSRRERQCLELVGRGKDDYAIAVLLGIQQSTAHNTVQRAMVKYGVATRTQAVVRAMRNGEIRIEDMAP